MESEEEHSNEVVRGGETKKSKENISLLQIFHAAGSMEREDRLVMVRT